MFLKNSCRTCHKQITYLVAEYSSVEIWIGRNNDLTSSGIVVAAHFLEGGPQSARIPAALACGILRAAFDRPPIGIAIIGWNLPEALAGCLLSPAVDEPFPVGGWSRWLDFRGRSVTPVVGRRSA
jgi:hypothetical protein